MELLTSLSDSILQFNARSIHNKPFATKTYNNHKFYFLNDYTYDDFVM